MASTPKTVVVVHAFGVYERGMIISDESVIAAIMGGGNARFIVPISVQNQA